MTRSGTPGVLFEIPWSRPVLQCCGECGGDGGWSVPIDIDRRHGGLIERWDRCRACEGTGEVASEPSSPIDISDLDEAFPLQGEPQ